MSESLCAPRAVKEAHPQVLRMCPQAIPAEHGAEPAPEAARTMPQQTERPGQRVAPQLSAVQAAALFGHVTADRSNTPRSEIPLAPDAPPEQSPALLEEDVRVLRAALHARPADAQTALRVLHQHPERVRRVREIYDAERSADTQGLAADLQHLRPAETELAAALLTRAGVFAGQRAAGYHRAAGPQSARSRHRIEASPGVAVAVPGSHIRYTAVPETQLLSEGTHYTYQWLCLNDPQHGAGAHPSVVWGPQGAAWDARWSFAGNHRLLCRVQRHEPTRGPFSAHTDDTPEYLEYPQAVHAEGDVLAQALRTSQAPLASPGAQLQHLKAYQQMLLAAEAQPGSARLDPHRKEELQRYIQQLSARLARSEGHARHPLRAFHVTTESARVIRLNAFASCISETEGAQTWTLVDLTNPTDRRLSGEYTGQGKDAQHALQSAVAAWDRDNRYPPGRLRVQAPGLADVHLDTEFHTDGASFWDTIAEYFGQVGFWSGIGAMGAAVVASFLPEPTVSKAAAALLWSALLGGAASASIHIAQRHAEGMATFREDAFDALTIAGSLLGARWALGATVKGLSLAGSRMGAAVVLGRIGADTAQGILLSVEYLEAYRHVCEEKDPQKRTDMLLSLLRSAAVSGGLLALSLHGGRADLKHAGAKGASLERLGNAGDVIDLAKEAAGAKLHAPEPAQPARVVDPVPGLYDSVHAEADVAPPGWAFWDTHDRHYGVDFIRTDVVSPDKQKGVIRRLYDPEKQMLTMSAAFLDKLPSWMQAGVPLRPDRGTPLVTYLTLRQMKLVGIPFGGLKTVKMSRIQNLRSILQLDRLVWQGIPLDEAVAHTHSVEYASTSIQQSGHVITGVRIDLDNARREPLDRLMNHYEGRADGSAEPRNPDRVAEHKALLSEFGVERSHVVLVDFSIYLDLAPHPGPAK